MKTTKRAYTMRLNGTTDDWQDALWETHETINCGVKLFGEWLLTFRGGVSPDLQYENLAELKTEEKIMITTLDEDTLYGIGFESDSDLKNWKILSPSGVTSRVLN